MSSFFILKTKPACPPVPISNKVFEDGKRRRLRCINSTKVSPFRHFKGTLSRNFHLSLQENKIFQYNGDAQAFSQGCNHQISRFKSRRGEVQGSFLTMFSCFRSPSTRTINLNVSSVIWRELNLSVRFIVV